MTIRPELRDELLKECSDPREVLAEGGLIKQLTKAIIERWKDDRVGHASGLPQAWTTRGRDDQRTQWHKPQEAQRHTGRDRNCSPT
jgi:hypothetical protein